jgi:redox-sensitive bicupin YhaK (pirin superfamily)
MTTETLPGIDIRKAADRFETRIDWLESYHSFSFSRHYDPENTHHGLLLVSNDDIIQPNTGFSTHPHRDMEIVTWVLSGELEHKDSEGNIGYIYPGLAQRMSAGAGILHSEINASKKDEPVHLVQMWVVPDTARIKPGYAQLDINSDLDRGGLVPVASGKHDAAIPIRQAGATLWAARLKPGERVTLPAAPFAHLYVALGTVEGDGLGTLGRGEAARLTSAGALPIRAGESGAEILLWEMDGTIAMR